MAAPFSIGDAFRAGVGIKKRESTQRAKKEGESSDISRERRKQEEAVESLRGRLGGFKFDRVRQDRSQQVTDIIGQRQQRADQGFGAGAFQAARESRLRGLQSAGLGQQRALASRQAATGVAGGAAGSQLAGLLAQQQASRQAAEQDLLLQEVAQKERALTGLESSVTGAEAGELKRGQFNIGLTGREALIRSTPDILAAQLSGANLGSLLQEKTAREFAARSGELGKTKERGFLEKVLDPIGLFG